MLADQLLNPEHIKAYHVAGDFKGYATWANILQGAAKFVIDRDLAQVIDDMPRKDVGAAMPFCRLPFPVCWIEVAQNDRPRFANMPLAEGHFKPIRVGLLCEQAADPTKFWATIAWSYSDADTMRQREAFNDSKLPPINVCPVGLYVDTSRPSDPMKHAYDASGSFTAPFDFMLAIAPYWKQYINMLGEDGVKLIGSNAENDWQGEPWFWLAAFALINARNGVASTYRPTPPKLNKARLKAGKAPLADYHQLTLRGRHSASQGSGIGQSDAHMRAHTVRGHFKVRKTGIYWWRPFMRGDVAEGFARKDYKVKL
jgi:hypothetical protein